MGLVIAAFGLGTKAGIFAALFIMINHALIKSLLFLSGTYMVYHSKDKLIVELNGLAKKLPFTAALFAFGALAIAGFPPFSGFWSKIYFLIAAAELKMIFLIIMVLLITTVEVVYYFRVVNRMYFYKPVMEMEYKRPTMNAYISMVALTLMILVVSFYPDLVIGYIHAAADDLMNRTEYINIVLNK
jgi:NADH-quinone oxidoreductase subunit N/multicomponent Na+:H+ antiporter subunit D